MLRDLANTPKIVEIEESQGPSEKLGLEVIPEDPEIKREAAIKDQMFEKIINDMFSRNNVAQVRPPTIHNVERF